MRCRILQGRRPNRDFIYRIQIWYWWWPFWVLFKWVNDAGGLSQIEFNSEIDAINFIDEKLVPHDHKWCVINTWIPQRRQR